MQREEQEQDNSPLGHRNFNLKLIENETEEKVALTPATDRELREQPGPGTSGNAQDVTGTSQS